MKVVHVKSHAFTHYIGRGPGFRAPTGKAQPVNANLGNPFPMGKERDRATVVRAFEDWVRNDPGFVASGFRARIKALPEDAVLGCFCAPLPCHGDVIVKIWKEMHGRACEDESCPQFGMRHAHAEVT